MILGESGVGKTSLMNKFINRPFVSSYAPTIGVEYEAKDISINQLPSEIGSALEIGSSSEISPNLAQNYYHWLRDWKNSENFISSSPDDDWIKLRIWNSAGQDKFRSIVSSYFRNTQGVVYVFDLTNPLSLEKIEIWLHDFQKNHISDDPGFGVPAILVGNKHDLLQPNIILDGETVQVEDLGDPGLTAIITQMKQIARKYHMPWFITSVKEESIDSIFLTLASMMLQKFLQTQEEYGPNIAPKTKDRFLNPQSRTRPSCC